MVFASNAADGLREAGVLPPGWSFASGNFALVADSLSVHSLSWGWAVPAFAGVVVLELAVAVLFWRAVREAAPLAAEARAPVLRPFAAGLLLFGGFLVCDELLLVYVRFPGVESTHFLVFCALIVSLLLIEMLRNSERPG